MTCGDYIRLDMKIVVLVNIVHGSRSCLRSVCHSFTANTSDPSKFIFLCFEFVEFCKNPKKSLRQN